MDELKPMPYDKINVDKMNFADADAEKHDMIDVDEMRTEQMYDRMDFNWTKVQTFFQGQSEWYKNNWRYEFANAMMNWTGW